MMKPIDVRVQKARLAKPKGCYECIYNDTVGAAACGGCPHKIWHKPGHMILTPEVEEEEVEEDMGDEE